MLIKSSSANKWSHYASGHTLIESSRSSTSSSYTRNAKEFHKIVKFCAWLEIATSKREAKTMKKKGNKCDKDPVHVVEGRRIRGDALSVGSSTSQPPSESGHSDESSPEALVREENRAVKVIRSLVIFILLSATIVTSYLIHYFTQSSQESSLNDAFEIVASKLTTALVADLSLKVGKKYDCAQIATRRAHYQC